MTIQCMLLSVLLKAKTNSLTAIWQKTLELKIMNDLTDFIDETIKLTKKCKS